MKKKLTYRAHNEQGVQIDKVMTTGNIVTAKKHLRKRWCGYLKITCDETGERLISKK